jgi:hypothetical protein
MATDHTTKNRHQRRAAEAATSRRRKVADGDIIVARDRADLLRIVASLVEAGETVSSATVITADGEVSHVDAAMLRRGGGRA